MKANISTVAAFSAALVAVTVGLWTQCSHRVAVHSVLTLFAFVSCYVAVPRARSLFVKAGVKGRDMNKEKQPYLPESMGVVAGAIYLITMFGTIPYIFIDYFLGLQDMRSFPHALFVEYLAALLSICCMIFLGFADDIFDLKWRYKLLLPTIASLPLLLVYYVTEGSTTVSVPLQLRPYLGHDVDIGILYYIYMGMLAVFCTNAINILAGVNGLEAGQAVVIGLSIIINNVIQLGGVNSADHTLSLFLLCPFVATAIALLLHNWYPASVFVGDTFCYFAGMTYAVVGILGKFSKTVLLFFIPQVINFLYSVPQLFRFLPCPRHRMPRLLANEKKLTFSTTTYKLSELSKIGRVLYDIIRTFRLADVKTKDLPHGDKEVTMSNLTLINFVLYVAGPIREDYLCMALLVIQVVCNALAFYIRYVAVLAVYDHN